MNTIYATIYSSHKMRLSRKGNDKCDKASRSRAKYNINITHHLHTPRTHRDSSSDYFPPPHIAGAAAGQMGVRAIQIIHGAGMAC